MGGETTRTTNRLARESSPYLQLHKHNPVDWYPWGEEAFEAARREGKAIFLSVGYSTCHWCHVMARESFDEPRIAELMNELFVNVKVDREERPDVDEVYMTATQILTGHGGWPNSVFLTPDGKPFYAGTYFPPEDRQGMPGFPRLLRALANAWQQRRSEAEMQAEELATAIRRYLEDRGEPGADPPSAEIAERAFETLAESFDERWGGFGGAPKFPTPANLYLLEELTGEREEAERMLGATLDRMARGGICDQLAGGFSRYATDREWKIPHFEKMLYDNGFLLELYARQAGRTGDPEAARVAAETAEFLLAEMRSPEGPFWSAIDAESEGREGAFYVWTREQLDAALGEEDATFLAPIYGFDGPPFFEGSAYVLYLPLPLAEQAERRRAGREELLAEIEPLRRRLREARAERPRPATDDKILADWNGTAITGLAEAGRWLGRDAYLEAAAGAARFLLGTLRADDGTLLHAWRNGEGGVPAFLADYAFLVRGLLALQAVTGEEEWLEAAVELVEEQERRLGDPQGGYFNAGEDPLLFARGQEVFDGAAPAANAVATLNLLDLAAATGEARWREAAGRTLARFGSIVEQQPQAARMMAVVARRYHRTAG